MALYLYYIFLTFIYCSADAWRMCMHNISNAIDANVYQAQISACFDATCFILWTESHFSLSLFTVTF